MLLSGLSLPSTNGLWGLVPRAENLLDLLPLLHEEAPTTKDSDDGSTVATDHAFWRSPSVNPALHRHTSLLTKRMFRRLKEAETTKSSNQDEGYLCYQCQF